MKHIIAQMMNTNNSTYPKAYINYILFDANYANPQFGYKVVSVTAAAGWEKLDLSITAPYDGFADIYLSNESNYNVYFDDLKIVHEFGDNNLKVVQAQDYYPFGATFNNYSIENSIPNKRLYQRKEYQGDLGLNIYDSDWRQYDPWLARTLPMDPHAEKYFLYSPYSWCAGNPISFIDPDGRDWYLNLYNGQVQFIAGSASQFERAYVHLASDGASEGEILDALSARGYDYIVNANFPGGYQVDTKAQYKGWIAMQTFSEENVAGVLGIAGGAFSPGTPGAIRGPKSVWGFNPSQRGFMIESLIRKMELYLVN